MAWGYPIVTLAYALAYGLQGDQRMASASYAAARSVMPMHAWAVVFALVALFKVGCYLRGTGRGYVLAMCAGIGLYSTWAFLFTVSVFVDDTANVAAPILPIGWVLGHVAMMATLTDRRGA